jgi:hypothetical protein
MKIRKKTLGLLLLALLGFCTQINAQVTQASKVMAQYEDAFFKKIETISTDYKTNMNNFNSFYLETLQKYMQVMKSRGALYEVQAAQAEINRFSTEKTLIAKDVNTEFDTFKKIQLACIDKIDAIDLQKSQEVVALYNKIIPALDKYKEQLTKEGNLNDAQWVDEKQKEFENSKFFKQAQTSIKMYEITHNTDKIGLQETVVQEEPQVPVSNNTAKDEEVAADTIIDPAIYGTIKIHHSKTTPRGHTREYKRFNLSSRTDLNSSALSVTAFTKNLEDNEIDRWPWARKFRLQINALTSKTDYNDCFIVVKYFGARKTAKRKAGGSALNLGYQIVQIPTPLTNSRLFLDMPTFPKVEAESWSPTSHLIGYNLDLYEFYGIIVSIYDADNKLIYQKASSDGLRPYARSVPPIKVLNIRDPEKYKVLPTPII